MDLGTILHETLNYQMEIGQMDYDEKIVGYLIKNKETKVIEWSTKVLPEAYHFIDELQGELEKYTGTLEKALH